MQRIIYQGSEAYDEVIGVLRTLYKWKFDPYAIQLIESQINVKRTIDAVWEDGRIDSEA